MTHGTASHGDLGCAMHHQGGQEILSVSKINRWKTESMAAWLSRDDNLVTKGAGVEGCEDRSGLPVM